MNCYSEAAIYFIIIDTLCNDHYVLMVSTRRSCAGMKLNMVGHSRAECLDGTLESTRTLGFCESIRFTAAAEGIIAIDKLFGGGPDHQGPHFN